VGAGAEEIGAGVDVTTRENDPQASIARLNTVIAAALRCNELFNLLSSHPIVDQQECYVEHTIGTKLVTKKT